VTDVSVLHGKIVQDTRNTTITRGSTAPYQSFVARESAITSIQFYFTHYSTPIAGEVNIKVYSHDTGNDCPNFSDLLGTATVSIAPETTNGWVAGTFSSQLSVTIGTRYWVTLSATYQVGYFEYFKYDYQNTDVYSDGVLGFYGLDTWYPTNYDLTFRVFFAQVKRAVSFNYSGSGTYIVHHVQVYLKKVGTSTPTVAIYADSSGPTGSAIVSKTLTNAQVDSTYGWCYVDLSDTELTKGTTYWLVVTDETQREAPDNILYWGGDATKGYASGSAMVKIGSAAWAADSTYDYYFRINSGEGFTNDVFKIFEYRGAVYAVDKPQEGLDASTLWLNGDRGVPDDNTGALGTLVDGTKTWTVNEWAGCIVKIVAGHGVGEYRTVVSNTADTLTVDVDWTSASMPSNTEYVILGSSKWTDVTPNTMTKPVTDVAIYYAHVLFAYGREADTTIYQAYTTSSAFSTRNENTLGGDPNDFDHLSVYDGKLYGSYHKHSDPNDGTWLYFADHKNYGEDTDFNSTNKIEIGDSSTPITGMCIYEGDIWVLKSNGVYAVKSNKAQLILDYSSFMDDHNGRNVCKHNVYLFFPMGYGLQRMYGLQVDNIGPDREEGLPAGRQGYVDDMLPVPGMLYAAVNGGALGTSSILAYNELGWHEIVRGDALAPITCMFLQVIPGGPNRLWFGMDNNACWVNVPAKSVDPSKDSDCDYASSGEIITSWVDLHLADVDKYFKDLKVVSEGLATSAQTITAYYQINTSTDADTWTLIGTYDTSPVEEKSIGNKITGRRIRFKFVFSTNDDSKTPMMLAWTMDALARVPPKGRWEPNIVLKDKAPLLNGAESTDPQTRAEIISQLDTWAGSATPLTMTTVDPAFTNVTVFIEPFIETEKAFQSKPDGIVSSGRLVVLEA
jgi:hypothetical protein